MRGMTCHENRRSRNCVQPEVYLMRNPKPPSGRPEKPRGPHPVPRERPGLAPRMPYPDRHES